MATTSKSEADPFAAVPKDPRKKQAERRLALRNEFFPGSEDEVWTRHGTKGYATVPRLLPLVAALIKDLSKSGDPSSVYLELWSRVFDEGLVAIEREDECAFASGYTGTRAVRTWRERMDLLIDLGFIRVHASGNRRYANVLIVNPLLVVSGMRKRGKPRIPDEWWAAFVQRASEISAEIPRP
jgi:hypothetical protein